jgi:hypothetical protein
MTRKDRPTTGEMVLLKGVPPGLPAGLPEGDQIAIAEAVGKAVLLVAYDEDGRAELEFVDKDEVIHFIYVDPAFIEAMPSHK